MHAKYTLLIVIIMNLIRVKSFTLRRSLLIARRTATTRKSHEGGDNAYPNFSFTIDKTLTSSKARLGTVVTPHGNVETPNFIFCGTKATMKSMSPAQLREANAQIMLSNTYHLMLTPGPDIIEKMGGLQKFSGWNGPMLTDSGGYQIFSMGFGSVSNEIKGKRANEHGENVNGTPQSLLKITEQGATFRSYVDQVIHELSPEKSIEIQRKLGADLILVLDECTPFNVDKKYTEDSMHRSHRWGDRSIKEFQKGCQPGSKYVGKQALYGIVQGGVYEDLRDVSCKYVNSRNFFGTAIGGSLGDSRQAMHNIVTYTRARVRDDRPVHLLGIGGIRDIFHGVRQGIDTFDCVHPSRLGRHGGVLVMASHWSEEPSPPDNFYTAKETETLINRWKNRGCENPNKLMDYFKTMSYRQQVVVMEYMKTHPSRKQQRLIEDYKNNKGNVTDIPIIDKLAEYMNATYDSNYVPPPRRPKKIVNPVKENIHVTRSMYASDPRPIDANCKCYTCSNFSRAYLNHLFKAGEMLAGTLCTIHNVHYMNHLMSSIREGIKNDNLDEVEKLFVHPDLLDESVEHNSMST